MLTELFSERWTLIDYLAGDAVAANTESNTGYNAVAGYDRVAVLVCPVDVNDALDVDLEQATDTSGTSAKTLDSGGKDITVATSDTLPSVIEINGAEFDVANGFDTLNVEVTTANTGGGGNEFAVLILGCTEDPPAASSNWDSVNN